MYFATPSPRLGYAGHRRARGRLRGLGDTSSIVAQVFAGESGSPAASNVQQVVTTAVNQGSMYTTENCTGIPASSSIESTALTAGGAVAIKSAALAGPAAPVLLVAGGIMELFGAIFGAHAAKVKQEQQIICAVVASCNDTFTSLDQLMQTGQISASQAGQALDAMYTSLQQNVQPILKQDSGHCNAACFILAEARGVILQRKALYATMVCNPPTNAPAGSYTQTCCQVQVNGDQLTASCKDANGNPVSTALPSISACTPGSIVNNDGILGCTPATTPASSSAAAAAGSIASYVENLASQFGIPDYLIWAIGAFALVELIA